jgi:hypothetical protein
LSTGLHSPAFIHSLESKGWETYTQLEDPSHSTFPPLEDLTGTSDEKEAEIISRLKALQMEKKALILRNSHIGGHKYAGNCIVRSTKKVLFVK